MNTFIFSNHLSCTQSAPACPSWPGLKTYASCSSIVRRMCIQKFFTRTQRPDLTVEYERLRTAVIYCLATVGGTRLWLDGEVGLPLQDGVDEFGVVSVHGVVSICGCHLGHGGPCRGLGNGSQRQS